MIQQSNLNISVAETFENLKEKKDELKKFVDKSFNQFLQAYNNKVICFKFNMRLILEFF